MKIRAIKQNFQFSIFNFQFSDSGFTLVELLVVVSILGMVSAFIIVNFQNQRNKQKIKIAQNELVTNLRKMQNYALSSRTILSDQSAQYYILKIDLKYPDRYFIQAIYDASSSPKLADNLETVMLPSGIRFAPDSPILITRPVTPLTDTPAYPDGCALVIYKLPFANTLFSNGCRTNNFSDSDSDDYKNLLDFRANTINSPGNKISADSDMIITLTDRESEYCNNITIQGMSGMVTFEDAKPCP